MKERTISYEKEKKKEAGGTNCFIVLRVLAPRSERTYGIPLTINTI
jgi:hypothetical protein